MKRRWVITIIACVLLLILGAVTVFMPRIVPPSECSEMYKRYAADEDIEATFVKGYKINDTVTLDVTLLEARDSVGWMRLIADFIIDSVDPEVQQKIDNGKDLISTKLVNKNDYRQPIDKTTTDLEVMAVSHLRKTVSIFHTRNKEERHAVLFYNYDKSVNQKQQ